MALHETFTQTVNGETLAAVITRPDSQPDTAPTILFIHGAGPGGKHRFEELATFLADNGHASLRFDHSGHGESSGELKSSSLTKRLEEAKAFLPLLHSTAPLTVMGSSMGGHIAARLLPLANFTTLIAQVPAAYTVNAENLPFDDTFTAALRTPGSWQEALIWPALETFTGTFLLISSGNDPVIPIGVLRHYWHHTLNAKSRTHLRMAEAEHSLAPWLTKNPAYFPAYTQAILNALLQ